MWDADDGDVNFKLGKSISVRAHSCLLRSRSHFFEALFTCGMKESLEMIGKEEVNVELPGM